MNDETNAAAQTSEPIQFITDLLGDAVAAPNPSARTITDPRVAAALIAEETRSRVRAVLERFDGVPTVLLSGGVDSIYLAAVAVRLGVRPHAITIVTTGDTDATGAEAATAALGLPHDVIRLTEAEVVDLARAAMHRLGTSELWEVAAGIPLLAARRSLDRLERVGAILTGSGADAIFGGGRSLRHPIDSAAAREELDRLIRAESAANFRYRRLVPHFHPALLNTYADKLVHAFQTVRWWRLAESLAPPALFGEHNGRRIDKLALRMACAEELPSGAEDLAWRAKAPIQRSSGLFTALAAAARSHAANLAGARTYTDPMTEDAEAVAIRLYLALLNQK